MTRHSGLRSVGSLRVGLLSVASRVLLALYPSGYRELVGADMRATFLRECRRIHAEQGGLALAFFGARNLAGFGIGALRAHAEQLALGIGRRQTGARRSRGAFDRLLQETRYAGRRLRRSPGFTAAALLTLGLGIGGSAAMFALVNRILLRPLPYPNASRVVALSHAAPGLGFVEGGQSWATFHYYRAHAQTLERVALHQEAVVNLTGDADPRRVALSLVTPSLFPTLGAGPLIGRVFDQQDADPGAPAALLISERLWRTRYGADSAIVGATIGVNGRPRDVIGVMADRFDFPTPDTDLWITLSEEAPGAVDDLRLSGVALVAAGRSIDEVRVELRSLASDLTADPAVSIPPVDRWQLTPVVKRLKTALVKDAVSVLWMLFSAVGIVLVVATVNITTLFLVRASDRQREIGIRRALGAVNRDMRNFFLAEPLLLSIGAGVIGAGVAGVALRFAAAWGPGDLPRLHEVRPDIWALTFTAALTLLIGVVVAWITGRHTSPRRSTGLLTPPLNVRGSDRNAYRMLVAFQVGMAFALLVGAGLMLQSFSKLRNVDTGFDAANVLTFDVSLPFGRYPTYGRAAAFFDDLMTGAAAMPGVLAVGAVSHPPLSPSTWTPILEPVEAAIDRPDDASPAPVHVALVTPGYFEALRIPIVHGAVAANEPRPVMISAPLARRLFGERPSVGGRVRRAGDSERPWNTVTAVIGPVRARALHLPATEILYLPILGEPPDPGFAPRAMTVVVRTAGPPTAIVATMRGLVGGLDPELSISNVGPLSRTVARATARWSFASTLLTAAAATALLLGTVGLYAVLSFAVARRAHEISIRMALGARAGAVRWMVMRQGGAILLVGLFVGLMVALAGTGFLGDLLYDLAPNDPMTFVSTAVVIVTTALIAGDVPARRAARMDPMRALKGD